MHLQYPFILQILSKREVTGCVTTGNPVPSPGISKYPCEGSDARQTLQAVASVSSLQTHWVSLPMTRTFS